MLKTEMPEKAQTKNCTGCRRIYNSCFYSLAGLKACLRTEEAFRLELVASIILIPAGLWLGDTQAEKACLAASVLIVLIVELLNTSVERAIDRISLERHELSKESKDMGSAAVSLSLMLWAVTWGLVLFF